jgi:hypothetical protein
LNEKETQMKLRKWGTASVALGLIAALTMISPALGGPSLQSLVKKEVAKQLNAAQTAKKKKKAKPGPAGPTGPAGANGANGAPGSALGFATITGAGGVDEANSSPNITDAMVTKENGNTEWCFNNMPFTPKIAIGVVDSNFGVGTTIQTTTAGAAGGCTGNEQSSVLEVNSTGTPVVGGVTFHIAFY